MFLNPILRTTCGILLLVLGFFMLCITAVFVVVAFTDKGPLWDEPGYKVGWIIVFLVMTTITGGLTWLFLYKGYKLCRPPEEKEEVIELLGEKF